MHEIWLTDIEQTKKILVLEESIKELQAELKQVRTEYERTREIVDELAVKFLRHIHEVCVPAGFGGVGDYVQVRSTDPPKKAE